MYLDTDEESQIVNAMKMAAHFSVGVETDQQLWRWIIIALHNAMQGIMVRALMDGTSYPVLTKECQQEFLKWADNENTPYPKERLASYLDLYKRIKRQGMGLGGGNSPFVARGREGKSIRLLNTFRNDFTHFTPKGWSLELDGLPRICIDCGRLISFLGWESENIHWYSVLKQTETQEAHTQFLDAMKTMDRHYRSLSAMNP